MMLKLRYGYWIEIPCALLLALHVSACGSDGDVDDGPPPPPADEPGEVLDDGGTITALSVAHSGDEKGESFMTHHPITVSMTIEPSTDYHQHSVHVGLVEKLPPGTEKSEARTCLLGTFEAAYGTAYGAAPTNSTGTATFSREFVIPDDCLAGGADQGTFNLWIGMNPALHESDDTPLAQADYNTQFFTDEKIDSEGQNRNDLCIDPDGDAGCIIDVRIERSGGHGVRLGEVALASSIGVIADNCDVDAARPLFEVGGTVSIFGSAARSGMLQGEPADNALEQVGDTDANVTVSYAVCPRADVPLDEVAPCYTGTDYRQLQIGAVEGSEDGPIDAVRFDHLIAGTPTDFEHHLFATPDSEACTLLTDAAGTAEDWSGHGVYNLRVCAEPSFSEDGPGAGETRDNCRVVPVLITVADPVHHGYANSHSLTKSFPLHIGNSKVGLDMSFSTSNVLDLSGATSRNQATATLTGFFSMPLLNVWANGAAYVSLVGSGIDVGVEIVGDKVFGYPATVDEIHWSEELMFSNQKCVTYGYGVAGIGLNLTGCGTGMVGLSAKLDVVGKEAAGEPPFDAATRIGQVQATVTPHGSLQLSITASLDAAVAKAGVTGTVDLIDVQLPAAGKLDWGLVGSLDDPKLVATAKSTLDLELSALSGNVNVWAEMLKLAWCDGSWYPCTEWASVYNQDLVSWPAPATWNQNLLDLDLGTLSLP